jgi:hypothetical protein
MTACLLTFVYGVPYFLHRWRNVQALPCFLRCALLYLRRCSFCLLSAHPEHNRLPALSALPQPSHCLSGLISTLLHDGHFSCVSPAESLWRQNLLPQSGQLDTTGHWSSPHDRNQPASLRVASEGRSAHGFLSRRASNAQSREQYFFWHETLPLGKRFLVNGFSQFRHTYLRAGIAGLASLHCSEQNRCRAFFFLNGLPQWSQFASGGFVAAALRHS